MIEIRERGFTLYKLLKEEKKSVAVLGLHIEKENMLFKTLECSLRLHALPFPAPKTGISFPESLENPETQPLGCYKVIIEGFRIARSYLAGVGALLGGGPGGIWEMLCIFFKKNT